MANVKLLDDPHYMGVYIEEKTWAKLHDKATSNKKGVSELVRNALDNLVKTFDEE